MRKLRFYLIGITVCLLFTGCLQIKERGISTDSEQDPTISSEVSSFSDYARVEAELAQCAQQISACETKLAELESKQNDAALPNPPAPESLYHYTLSDNGYATVTSYLGSEETVVIPSSLGGCPVIAIGEEAFRNGSAVSVVIPSGVRRVDWFAFDGCYRLSSVTLPDSVVSIGYGAFDLCAPSLTFTCSENSYAAGYAQSYGIATVAP